MSDSVETVTLEITPGAPPPAPVPVSTAPEGFSGAPGDFAKDMALLAAQSNPQTQTPPAVEPVKAVEPEQPTTAPVTPVPDKFKAPDGEVDLTKVAKSTLHAEDALKKFNEIERQLRQKQNEVAALKNGAPIPVAPAAVPANVQLSPFEIQVAQDMINEAAALGQAMPQAQAIAQARVMVRMMEAKHNAEASMTESLRQRIEDQDRRRELEAIGKEDPAIFSPEGIEALSKIRMETPLVNQSPNPWQMAYDLHLAQQIRAQRLAGQVTPTPKGPAAKAPPTPVGPVPRVVVQPQGPDLSSKEAIDSHVNSLDAKGQDAFFAKFGLKFR